MPGPIPEEAESPPDAEKPEDEARAAASRLHRAMAIGWVSGTALGMLVVLAVLAVLAARGKGRSEEPTLASVGPDAAVELFVPQAQASDAATDADLPVDVDGGAVVFSDAAGSPPPPPRPAVWRVSSMAQDSSVRLVDGTVGHRSFLAAIGALGLPKGEGYRIMGAFEGLHSFEKTNPKDTFSIAKDKTSGRVVAFEYATSPVEVWQAREASVETPPKLVGARLELHVERKRVAVGLVVGKDLRASITSAHLDDDLLKMLDDALDGHAELSDVRAGTKLRIVATEDRVEGEFARYVGLDAVEYTKGRGEPLRVYYFAYGKEAGFYDAKGHKPYHGGWRSPLSFARVTSRFNPRRMHPVLHVLMPHNGVDFAASTGTPVYASAAGTVRSAGDSGPCGNMVSIEHAENLTTAYCHLSRFAPGIHGGSHVEARQLIGFAGQTGRVTGPHLHFAVKRGDMFIDPLGLRLDGVRSLPPRDRDDFARLRADLDGVLDATPFPHVSAAASAEVAPDEPNGGVDAEEPILDENPEAVDGGGP